MGSCRLRAPWPRAVDAGGSELLTRRLHSEGAWNIPDTNPGLFSYEISGFLMKRPPVWYQERVGSIPAGQEF